MIVTSDRVFLWQRPLYKALVFDEVVGLWVKKKTPGGDHSFCSCVLLPIYFFNAFWLFFLVFYLPVDRSELLLQNGGLFIRPQTSWNGYLSKTSNGFGSLGVLKMNLKNICQERLPELWLQDLPLLGRMLVWLLARVPQTHQPARKGEVAIKVGYLLGVQKARLVSCPFLQLTRGGLVKFNQTCEHLTHGVSIFLSWVPFWVSPIPYQTAFQRRYWNMMLKKYAALRTKWTDVESSVFPVFFCVAKLLTSLMKSFFLWTHPRIQTSPKRYFGVFFLGLLDTYFSAGAAYLTTQKVGQGLPYERRAGIDLSEMTSLPHTMSFLNYSAMLSFSSESQAGSFFFFRASFSGGGEGWKAVSWNALRFSHFVRLVSLSRFLQKFRRILLGLPTLILGKAMESQGVRVGKGLPRFLKCEAAGVSVRPRTSGVLLFVGSLRRGDSSPARCLPWRILWKWSRSGSYWTVGSRWLGR